MEKQCKRNIVGRVLIVLLLLVVGCSEANDVDDGHKVEMSQGVDIHGTGTPTLEEQVHTVELGEYFDGTVGTAIFLTQDGTEYVHQPGLVNVRHSPYSTFKVLSTLMGLDEEILHGKESTMAYDGSTYWNDHWNDNLNLSQAFQYSCVWYYHQMVYQLSPQIVQSHLLRTNYGNMNTSQWFGSGSNSNEDLNGFWLGSSLKISPKEQVQFLHGLFNAGYGYSPDHIKLLAELMETDTENLYGKTGGGKDESWYVGYFLDENKPVYFAVFLEGNSVSGAMAKEIIVQVMEDWVQITNLETNVNVGTRDDN